jgi:hypothetical protein
VLVSEKNRLTHRSTYQLLVQPHLILRLDAVLEAGQLREAVPQLDTHLARIDPDHFAHSEVTPNRFPSILNNLLTAGQSAEVGSPTEIS